jgi:hypothetical protein
MAAHPHHWLAAVVAVVAVLASVVVIATVRDHSGTAPSGGRPPAAGTAPSSSTSTASGTSTSGTSPASTTAAGAHSPAATDPTRAALARCQSGWRQETAPLTAAARSLAQWRVHVGAMNQLVAGKISLPQAQAFWSSTRVAAAARADRFQQAWSAFRNAFTGCRGKRIEQLATGNAVQLRSCAAGVAARRHALASAATAVDTWQHHIGDMEMFRMGRMTPAQATATWLQNWRLGVAQLSAYDRALLKAQVAPHC